MPSQTSLFGFVVAALVVLWLPGPGVVYVVTRSVSQGRLAGLVSALGLSIGVFFHVAAATAGLSALLLTSVTSFFFVKMLGAAYLIYLGISTLLARGEARKVASVNAQSLRRLFIDGVVVSILNPKIAVFFLAFLPQFVNPAGSVPLQMLLLGVIYAVLALMTDSTYALLASSVRHWLSARIIQGPLLRYLSGCVYLSLGLHVALTGRRT